MENKAFEEKLDLVVTDVLSLGYELDRFDEWIGGLGEFLEKNEFSDLNRKIEKFVLEEPKPEKSDGSAPFLEDVVRSVDVEKYPFFKQHSEWEEKKPETKETTEEEGDTKAERTEIQTEEPEVLEVDPLSDGEL